jgi:hypothetical protein
MPTVLFPGHHVSISLASIGRGPRLPNKEEGNESLHTGDSVDQLAKNRLFSRSNFLMG